MTPEAEAQMPEAASEQPGERELREGPAPRIDAGPLADVPAPPPAPEISALDDLDDPIEPRRRQRQRWGERQFKLPRHVRPGFVPRVFNDVPGRVDLAKRRGYRHVLDDKGLPINLVVDETSGLKAYLMEIPQEFYDEDFADKQAHADMTDMAILNKALEDGGYRPTVPNTTEPMTKMQVVRGKEPGR